MTWPPTTHQDVEDDLTDGHGWAGSLLGRFGVAETATPAPLVWAAGRWYGSTVAGGGITTLAPTANQLYLTPLYFPTSRTVDRLGISVTTAGSAGSLCRVGLYNASATTGLPTTALIDSGSLAADSTGDKIATISQSLAGLYWLAFTGQAGTYRAQSTNATCAALGTSALSTGPTGALSLASTNAASTLPDLTSTGLAYANNGNLPAVMLRAA